MRSAACVATRGMALCVSLQEGLPRRSLPHTPTDEFRRTARAPRAAPGGADAKIEPSYMKAQISIMAPGTHVAPHTGPTNERLVISLGLAGLDGAQLRVGDEWKGGRQGEAILFDDSFEHEVKINGEEPRAVLIVHFQHPQMMPAGTNGAGVITSEADERICL